jgi:hypothetical protein
MTDIKEVIFPASNTFEENIVAMAEHYNNITEPGHGFFFDFSNTPEYEKPVMDYLIKNYGWKFDHKNTFIRKPE